MLNLPGATEEEPVMNFSHERCFQGIPRRYNPNPSYQTGLLVLEICSSCFSCCYSCQELQKSAAFLSLSQGGNLNHCWSYGCSPPEGIGSCFFFFSLLECWNQRWLDFIWVNSDQRLHGPETPTTGFHPRAISQQSQPQMRMVVL